MVFPSQKRINHGWSSEELLVSWHPWSYQITLPSGCCGSNSGNFCKASSETCSWGWDKGMTDPLKLLVLQQSNPPLSLRHKFVKLQLKFGHCPNDFGPCSVWRCHPWAWFYVFMLKSFALYGDACKPKHSLQFSIHGCSALQWVLWPQPRCLIRNMCISKPPKIKESFPLSFQTPFPCCKCSQHWLP